MEDQSPPSSPSLTPVALVGAGPGDPGLLTLRARDLLSTAQVLVYDYLVSKEILQHTHPDAERIYVGKQAGDHTLSQEEINSLLVEKAQAGLRVVRLKGGDPIIFGRGAEEAAFLRQHGLDFEIVPGISSAIAGPIYAGIPVTHRDHAAQLTIFTGHEDPSKQESSLDYAQLAKTPGTLVMLMGIGRMRTIASQLVAHGADPATQISLIRWATTPRQQTLEGTLATIADLIDQTSFKPPAVAVIGSVNSERQSLRWFDSRPLGGRRIVVTRTREQSSELVAQLRQLGADPIELPTIRIEGPPDEREFAELVMDAHTYDWLIFTSPNGVDQFFHYFYRLFEDARAIGGVRTAAIGPGTARRLKAFHVATDLMPEQDFVAEGLVEAFNSLDVENLKVLWVRPEDARPALRDSLSRRGAILDEAIAYRTVPEREDISGGQARLAAEGADMITFTSASTVESFFALGLPLPKDIALASIGPVTSAALRALGHTPSLEATEHSIPGLVAAIQSYWGS